MGSNPITSSMTTQELTEILYLKDAIQAFPMRKKDLLKIASRNIESRSEAYKQEIELLRKS